MLSHAVVYPTRCEYHFGVVIVFCRFVRQIIRVDTNTMASNKTMVLLEAIVLVSTLII